MKGLFLITSLLFISTLAMAEVVDTDCAAINQSREKNVSEVKSKVKGNGAQTVKQ